MASTPQPDYHAQRGGGPPTRPHYPSYPSSSVDSFDHPRTNHHHQQQQPYFDPPPREAYTPPPPPPADPDARYDSYDTLPRPGPQHPGNAYPDERDRSTAPLDANEGQLTPYDDERAEAEWRRGVDDAYSRQSRHQPPPPPPSDHDERWNERARLRQMQRDREREDDRLYYEGERERERDRDLDREQSRRERDRRNRANDEAMKEKALRYPSDPKKGGRDVFGSSEGEHGTAARLAGAAGGAWLAHEASHDALGTLGGLVLGAVAAGALERFHEERKSKKENSRRRDGEFPYPGPGRDMEDVRRTGRDRSARARTRSRSGGEGFRDRMKRSISRLRSKSRGAGENRRRRSDSLDSEDRYRR